MKILGLMLLSSICFAAPSLEETKSFTVLIGNETLGSGGRGTGILIDSTHVLTCAHMGTSFDDTFFVYTYPLGKVTKAYMEARDDRHDLAILVLVSSVPVKHVPVFQEVTEVGESITVIGNVLGSMKWFVSRGVVSDMEGFYTLTDASINPGNSGGPWINTKGEVVAISDWLITPPHGPGISGGVSSKVIIGFIKAYESQNDMSKMLQKLLGGE